jgi:hypothetical protein
MAKEDQAIIGLNKPTIVMIVLILSVIGGAAFWKDRGSAEAKTETIHNSIVASHENRITANTSDIKEVKSNQHEAEKARIKLDGKLDLVVQSQQTMDHKQDEMSQKQDKFIDYLMQYDYDKKKDTE